MKRLSIALVAALSVVFGRMSSSATDFHILFVNQSAAQQLADPPTGVIMINGGYEHGLEPGMTGDLWDWDSLSVGSVRLGEVTVQAVTADEATCSVVLNSGRPAITPDYRVSIDPCSEEPAASLEYAEAAFQRGEYEHALFFFDKVQWLLPDNPIAREHAPICSRKVDSAKAAGVSDKERQQELQRIPRYLDIAHRYLKLRDDKKSREYSDKLWALDSTNARINTLRSMAPTDESYIALRTDCYPIPPYVDSATPMSATGPIKMSFSGLDPHYLLYIDRDPAQFVYLIDRRGRVAYFLTTLSSGSSPVDNAITRVARHMKYEPIVRDGEPVCGWMKFEYDLPEPPRDSLIADYLASIIARQQDVPEKYRTWEWFFGVRDIDVDFYRDVYEMKGDSASIQRKIDSILFDRWPEAFQTKYWKQLKDKPEYFKEWEKDKKKR